MLDVGCGDSPKGEVNCDLFTGRTPHIMGYHHIDPKKIPNFVLCSAEQLPFRDDAFDIVNASEILEHLINPSCLLTEMRRVSRESVTLDVPNLRRLTPEENPYHLYTWSRKSLHNLLSLFFKNVIVVASKHEGYVPDSLMRGKTIGFLLRLLESFIEKLLGPPFLKAVCRVPSKNLMLLIDAKLTKSVR